MGYFDVEGEVEGQLKRGRLGATRPPGKRRRAPRTAPPVGTASRCLPDAPVAAHDEVLAYIERNQLMGIGIGWVDAHLLASVVLSHSLLLTLDKRLRKLAESMGVFPG